MNGYYMTVGKHLKKSERAKRIWTTALDIACGVGVFIMAVITAIFIITVLL